MTNLTVTSSQNYNQKIDLDPQRIDPLHLKRFLKHEPPVIRQIHEMHEIIRAIPVSASRSISKVSEDVVIDPRTQVNRAIFHLGQKLAQTFADKNPGKSFVFSPLSIAYVLGMILSGLQDSDQNIFLEILELDSLEVNEVHKAFAALTEELSSEDKEGLKLELANALITANIPINPDYIESVKENYSAEVFKALMSPEKLCNDWVSKKTHGEIPQVLQENSLDLQKLVAVLINAVYFKGDWKIAFDASETSFKTFTTENQETHFVKMMHHDFNQLRYYEDADFQMVLLPYKSDSTSAYYTAVLPRPGVSLEKITAKLDPEYLKHCIQEANFRKVDVFLPKSKLEFSAEILSDLVDLGLPINKYLPNLTSDAKVDQIIHKAKIEVDEEGTVAAAVTAAIITKTACQPSFELPKIFNANRPFNFYLIQENTNGDLSLLFQGSIKDSNALESK